MPFLNCRGTVVHYQVFGSGEPVVLVHGLAANMAFWYPLVITTLAKYYTVIAYDLRGHGKSGMPASGYLMDDLVADLQQLLYYLQLDRAHVIGHSYGARVVTYFTLKHPEKTLSLTIADTRFGCVQPMLRLCEWPYWTTWKQQMQQKGVTTFPDDDQLMTFQLLLDLDRIYTEATQQSMLQKQHRPGISLKNRRLGLRGAAKLKRLFETTQALAEFEQSDTMTIEQLTTINPPTLLLFGEWSHCLPACEKLQMLIPQATTTLIPEVGHFYPAVKPKLTAQALMGFLEQRPVLV